MCVWHIDMSSGEIDPMFSHIKDSDSGNTHIPDYRCSLQKYDLMPSNKWCMLMNILLSLLLLLFTWFTEPIFGFYLLYAGKREMRIERKRIKEIE